MNKNLVIVLVLAIAVILPSFQIVHAQEIPGAGEIPLSQEIKTGQQAYEEFSAQEKKEEYLAKEWTTIIRNSPALNWIYKLNPVFKFLFGYEFALSWAFITALLIWIIIFSVFRFPARLLFNEGIASLGIALAISIIAAHSVMQSTIDNLAKVIKNIWWNLGTIVLLIILIYVINMFSKSLAITYRKKREQAKLAKASREAKEAKEETKEITSEINAMGEEFSESGGI